MIDWLLSPIPRYQPAPTVCAGEAVDVIDSAPRTHDELAGHNALLTHGTRARAPKHSVTPDTQRHRAILILLFAWFIRTHYWGCIKTMWLRWCYTLQLLSGIWCPKCWLFVTSPCACAVPVQGWGWGVLGAGDGRRNSIHWKRMHGYHTINLYL